MSLTTDVHSILSGLFHILRIAIPRIDPASFDSANSAQYSSVAAIDVYVGGFGAHASSPIVTRQYFLGTVAIEIGKL